MLRLSRYLRRLRTLDRQEMKVVSSRELAESTGTTAAQVRKDLSHFGSFGKRGQGYAVTDLRVQLEEILGLTRRWRVAVLGVGRIGSALLGYGFFTQRGFDVVAAFDTDRSMAGREVDPACNEHFRHSGNSRRTMSVSRGRVRPGRARKVAKPGAIRKGRPEGRP